MIIKIKYKIYLNYYQENNIQLKKWNKLKQLYQILDYNIVKIVRRSKDCYKIKERNIKFLSIDYQYMYICQYLYVYIFILNIYY